jgi:hypothetical protein
MTTRPRRRPCPGVGYRAAGREPRPPTGAPPRQPAPGFSGRAQTKQTARPRPRRGTHDAHHRRCAVVERLPHLRGPRRAGHSRARRHVFPGYEAVSVLDQWTRVPELTYLICTRPDRFPLEGVFLSGQSHRDDNLPSSVSLFQISDGVRRFAQRVRPVDDRLELAVLDELLQEPQVILIRLREKRAELLTHER